VLSAAGIETMQNSGPTVNDYQVTYGMGGWSRPQWELSTDPGDPAADSATARVIEHEGSWPNTHTYMGFVPSTGLGVVLLVNGNDVAAESQLVAMDRNVWNVLMGQPTELGEATEEFLLRAGSFVGIAIVAVQLALMWWSIWLLRKRSRQGIQVPRRRRLAVLLAPLAFDLAVIGFLLIYLPAHFAQPLRQIVSYAPDSGLLIMIALGLAIGWGTARTVLLVRRPCRAEPAGTPTAPHEEFAVGAG